MIQLWGHNSGENDGNSEVNLATGNEDENSTKGSKEDGDGDGKGLTEAEEVEPWAIPF